MFGFGGPAAPARVTTDRVVPVGFFDNTIIFRTFVLYTLFAFDDVLDPERLRTSLECVVARPGWNKLGARVRRNASGDLEHHIPASYSEERPAIGYDHLDLSDVNLKEHPAASHIPKPPKDGHPAIVSDPDKLADLYSGPAIPKGLNDYIYSDRPELGLRVVSFKNKTVVVLHWIHLAFDATAKKALLDAWVLMLQGREDEIPEPLAPDNYILENVGKNAPQPHALASKRVYTLGLVTWVLRNIYSLAISSKEHRMLCVPPEFLNKLKKQALDEVKTKAAEAGQEDVPFLSEGDVLLAWTTRLAMTASLSRDSETTVAAQQAYQFRPVLKDLNPMGRPFLSNCVSFLVSLMPAKDVLQKPLSHLASSIRHSIKEQGTREQVEAYTSLVRKDPANRAPPFFGESGMQLVMFSNWSKSNMFATDLSAAAVNRRSEPLCPSYVQSVQGPYNFNDGIIVVGKDMQGNHWLSGYRAWGLWGLMEEEIARQRA